jgi:hypothetical protein
MPGNVVGHLQYRMMKILWHRNVNTTLQKDARRFDESTGCVRMDDCRTSRSKKVA